VNYTYKVADEETHGPLQQIHVQNDLDYLLFHAILSHDKIFFETTEDGHADCKSLINLLNLGDNERV
jgi:hypothetical protein